MTGPKTPRRRTRAKVAAGRARASGWFAMRAPPAPARLTAETIAFGAGELVLSALGLVFLWRDLGAVGQAEAASAIVLSVVGGLVAGYTWIVGARQQLWGPKLDPWPVVVFDLVLLAFAVISVGLMAAVHPSFGVIALQGLWASVFVGSIRRTVAPQGCVTVLAAGYGALLLFLAVMLLRELESDATRNFSLGFTAVLTLAMPGVRTLLMGVPAGRDVR